MSTGATAFPAPQTLMGTLWPSRSLVRTVALMLLGTVLLTLSAKIQVPFHPVPMTMQTLAVLVIGAAYGSWLGLATIMLYLVEGVLGLPVFAGPLAGPAYLLGPTGGFLIGFAAAAFLTGLMAERGFDRGLARAFFAMAIGHMVIFAFGLGWLCAYLPAPQAWAIGAAPFVAATLLKTALAAALLRASWGVLKR